MNSFALAGGIAQGELRPLRQPDDGDDLTVGAAERTFLFQWLWDPSRVRTVAPRSAGLTSSRDLELLRSDDTEAVSAKHQACPHLAVHVHPDRTLEMGATEMGAAIGCPLVGDSTRGTETAEPLTSTPASWAARLGALNERSVP